MKRIIVQWSRVSLVLAAVVILSAAALASSMLGQLGAGSLVLLALCLIVRLSWESARTMTEIISLVDREASPVAARAVRSSRR